MTFLRICAEWRTRTRSMLFVHLLCFLTQVSSSPLRLYAHAWRAHSVINASECQSSWGVFHDHLYVTQTQSHLYFLTERPFESQCWKCRTTSGSVGFAPISQFTSTYRYVKGLADFVRVSSTVMTVWESVLVCELWSTGWWCTFLHNKIKSTASHCISQAASSIAHLHRMLSFFTAGGRPAPCLRAISVCCTHGWRWWNGGRRNCFALTTEGSVLWENKK